MGFRDTVGGWGSSLRDRMPDMRRASRVAMTSGPGRMMNSGFGKNASRSAATHMFMGPRTMRGQMASGAVGRIGLAGNSIVGRWGAVGLLGAASLGQFGKANEARQNGHYGSAILRTAVGASAAFGAIGYGRYKNALGSHLAIAASKMSRMVR